MTPESLVKSAAFALFLMSAPISAQQSVATESGALSYADLADLSVRAPLVMDVQIKSATRLKAADASIPAGIARFYVEAQVRTLIRGATGSPALVNYVADVPLDARGRAPKLKKLRALLLARPVAGRPGMIQLVAPHAQIAWNQSVDTQIRAILTELTAPNAAPAITGVRSAFHVPGTVQGEGESQIFLQTATGNPVSISILRRPGEIARWSVALGEIVDEAAGPPRPGSLLWYRLACSLPPALPAGAIDPGEPANAEKARADYRVVIDGLGPCGRTKTTFQPSSGQPSPGQPSSRPR